MSHMRKDSAGGYVTDTEDPLKRISRAKCELQRSGVLPRATCEGVDE